MKIGIYPGSFDPPTLGHMDIARRGAALFDRLIVAVGDNVSKPGYWPVAKRIELLQECLKDEGNIVVESFQGLLVDYARRKGAISIVRGLRAVSDFDYEFQIAIANQRMSPDLETVLLMTKWEYSYISSSVVREVARLGGDVSPFVPPQVVQALNLGQTQ